MLLATLATLATGYSTGRKEMNMLRALANTILSRADLNRLDSDGKRDLDKVFGYPKSVSNEALWRLFSRQNIARRIVVAPASAAWSNPPRVFFEKGEAQEKWDTLIKDKRLNVWFQLARLDILCGMGEYAILFISTGVGDPAAPARTRSSSARSPSMLVPYAQMAARIVEMDEDVRSPNFGRPKMYQVTPDNSYQKKQAEVGPSGIVSGDLGAGIGGGSDSTKIQPFNIHYTRVVHATEEAFDNDTFGAPRLRPVYNDLLDMVKVVGGAAETFWLAGNRGLHIDVDKELEFRSEDAKKLEDEVSNYMDNLSRVIRTRGVDVENLGSDVPDPSNTMNALVSLICGATTIPRRILMGSEAGHLASEQDRANWADRVRERNELFCKPRILWPFILRLQDMGMIPESDFEADWPDPFTLSPIERSQAFSNWARGLASVSTSMESGAIMVTREEVREMAGLKPQPEPGMGELAEFDTNMFTPEENVQMAPIRERERARQEATQEDDREDSSSSGQNPQTSRS